MACLTKKSQTKKTMVELIELLNETSSWRVLGYALIFLAAIAIPTTAVSEIIGNILKSRK